MFCLHMLGQLGFRDIARWLAAIGCALVTPEAKRSVDAILMLAQGASRIVTGRAVLASDNINVWTWIWCKLEMVGADVALKRLW